MILATTIDLSFGCRRLAPAGPGGRLGACPATFGGSDQCNPLELPVGFHGELLGRYARRQGGARLPQTEPRQAFGPVPNGGERDHAGIARGRAGHHCRSAAGSDIADADSRSAKSRQTGNRASREAHASASGANPTGSSGCAGGRAAHLAADNNAGTTGCDHGDLQRRCPAIMPWYSADPSRPPRLPGGQSGEPVVELLRRAQAN
jgi:hypothetical protein